MISGSSFAHVFSSSSDKEIKKEYDEENEQNANNNKFGKIECYISDVKSETHQPDDNYLPDIKEEGYEVNLDVNDTNNHSLKNTVCLNNEIKEEISEVTIKCIITEGEYSCCNGYIEEGTLSILNNCSTAATVHRALKTIPHNYLVFRQGIFTLKCLSKNIIFGPYTGLESLRSNNGFGWKLKADNTLAELGNSQHRNWMRFINITVDKSQQNLCVFQWNGFLYYRSVRQINCGEELLVYLEEDSIRKFSSDIGKYYYPLEEEVPNIFACIPCCLGFSSEKCLREHKINHCTANCYKSDDIVHCPICKIVAFEKKYLKYHVKSDCAGFISKSRIPKDIEQLYKCNVCNAVYTHKNNLARHKKKHTGIKYLSCHQCGYRTDQKTTLRKHMSMHTKEFACSKCDFISDRRGGLQDHTAKAHASNSQSDNKKDNDTKKFAQIPQNIDTTNVAEFKCSICSKVLTEKGSLKRHLRVHTGEKPYKCDFCDYRCSQVGSLSKHLKRHTGEKPHVCQICNMRFLEKCKLKRHMNVHLVEKFYCSKCNYKTRSGNALDKHVKTCHAFD